MKQIVFSKIEENDSFRILMASGRTNEGLRTHISDKDAYMYVLSGAIQFTLGDEGFLVGPDEGIHIPATQPHSLIVIAPSRMMLTLDRNAKLKFSNDE